MLDGLAASLKNMMNLISRNEYLNADDSNLIHIASWLSVVVYDRNEEAENLIRKNFGPSVEVYFINRDSGENARYRSDTELFLIRKDNLVIVAVRGSEPSSFRDWVYTDFNHQMVPAFGIGNDTEAKIHSGFAAAVGVVWSQLYEILNTLWREAQHIQAPATLLLTGHSLGGAIANLIAASLASQSQLGNKDINLDRLYVHTFGQPVTGNKEYSDWYNTFSPINGVTLKQRTIRHVYAKDLLPRVPSDDLANLVPSLDKGWKHTGIQYYYDNVGKYQADFPDIELADVFLLGRIPPRMISPLAFHDHLPWLYLWCGEGGGNGNHKFGHFQLYHEARFFVVFSINAVERAVESWKQHVWRPTSV